MFRTLLRPLLFLLPPETAHTLAASVLRFLGRWSGLAARLRRAHVTGDRRVATRAFGLEFPSVVGMAAGFDKGDGLASGLFALGFGSVEVGTITPRPQPGNPKPRLFRLPRHGALINRMGFNNAGVDATHRRYRDMPFRPGPVGFNLGKNKDTPAERAADDYLRCLDVLEPLGDYFVVNVSSPNTPGLRDLQAPDALRGILRPLLARTTKPVLVKLAPDLPDAQIEELSDLALEEGAAGLILANTTLDRSAVAGDPAAGEAGGLSGAPLLEKTLHLVALLYRRHGERLPIVGVGGVRNAEDAWRMIRAGARLVQVYTGFIYGGPTLVRDIERGLARYLDEAGLPNIEAAIGLDAQR